MRPPRVLFIVVVALVALAAVACVGGSATEASSDSGGKPVYGGTITYGLEGKTTAFCPPEGQWALGGLLVADAVYDTLTRPTDQASVYAPYLAKAVTPNAGYTQWTIVIRSGIRFHDGSPLTAEAVKQNIDAWRKGLLLHFIFQNIADTVVAAPDTVVVTMHIPWIAFPNFLWSTGRAAIAAPSQLNNVATCDTNMIGTGPFRLNSFDPATGDVSVVRNGRYWRKGFPYLDGINFKTQEETSQRITGLAGGDIDIINISGGSDLEKMRTGDPEATIIAEPDGRMEISHTLVNVTRPPLDDLTARRAVALAIDRNRLNQLVNHGSSRLTNQVFDTEVLGYLPNLGYPNQNLASAEKLVASYKAAHGGKFEFTIQSTFDATDVALVQELKRQLGQVGITVDLPTPVDQTTIISRAIGGRTDAFSWRNYTGEDPDTMYTWFHQGSAVNLNHITDPIINQALDRGRSNPNPSARKQAYETFNRRMTDQLYNFWTWYTQWFAATRPRVHGIIGPNLPDETGNVGTVKPVKMLGGWHQTLGIWKDK